MPSIILFVISETLSDGSTVYNVHLGDNIFAATSEDAAASLAEAIADAINEHTAETASVIIE